nr:type II toxin-antitoxin system RelE/ParE family toxin [Desulfobulbaceae bacterium]
MAYRLTRKAIEDIRAIFTEGAHQFGLDQAEKYHDGLERVFMLLSDNPELARSRLELYPPVCVYPYGSHLIIYLVEENRDVLIVRVRHGHEYWMDQDLS